ncbi:MAG: hypothetical protein R3E66_09845 [bacterium]
MKRSSIALVLLMSASTSMAQERINDVTVQRIRPSDLPTLEETKIPTVLGSEASMPRMPTAADISAMQRTVASMTVRVIVEAKPFSTLQRTPIVMEGQAVWISAQPEGADPILVTPAHWVDGASKVWVHPPEPDLLVDQLSVGRSDIKAYSTNGPSKLLADPDLVPASVRVLDRDRNLAVLEIDPEHLAAPDKGLLIYPIETRAISYLYGLTPYSQFRPQIARIVEPDRSNEALLYYLASDFLAAPGAPLAAPPGEVVSIVAMMHPTEPLQSLIIPPLILLKFVRTAQGLDQAKLVEDVAAPK